jgi:DNA-binding NarL/FixJ family response regulator
MNLRGDIPLRLSIVAGSYARRASLSDIALRALAGRVQVIADLRISPERLAAAGAEIVLADLDDHASAAALIHFLADAPAGTGAVALIDEPDPAWVRSALSASVNAILARDVSADDLHLALRAAEAGLVLLHPSSVSALARENFGESAQDGITEELTAREAEVLRLVSQGLGNKEIAGRLEISGHTVKFHISSILGKLNAASRTEAVSLGIKRGLIPI